MLPSYFDYIFVHLRQKARLRPELSPKSLSTLGPNPTRKARPDLQLWVYFRINQINISNEVYQKVIRKQQVGFLQVPAYSLVLG